MDPIIANLSALANGAFRARLQLPAWLMAREGSVGAPEVTLQGQVRTGAGVTGSPAATLLFGAIDTEGYYDVHIAATDLAALVVGSPYHYDIIATEPDDSGLYVIQFGLFAVAPGVTIPGYVPPPPPTLTISGTPGAPQVGVAYSFVPTVSGGIGGDVFTLTGTLPAGLAFSASTGAITGTPTTAGTSTGLNITVASGTQTVSLGAFSLVVAPAAATVPAAPTLGTVVVGDTQLTITFTDGATGGAAITAHRVYEGPSAGSLTLLGTITTGSPFVDTGLTNGVARYYAITAVNSVGESAQSAVVYGTPASITPPPGGAVTYAAAPVTYQGTPVTYGV